MCVEPKPPSGGQTKALVASWWFSDPGPWPGASNLLTISRSPKNAPIKSLGLEIKNKNNDLKPKNWCFLLWVFLAFLVLSDAPSLFCFVGALYVSWVLFYVALFSVRTFFFFLNRKTEKQVVNKTEKQVANKLASQKRQPLHQSLKRI